ncbi:hypothetical protein M9Y10_035301 [Tritrichomonas musculus]|uniref:Nuclear transport factor 2 n=1 Tax=Tritrichomonas musculus TaxID=1915356 RepID=A0ABR2KHG5_9EUKA
MSLEDYVDPAIKTYFQILNTKPENAEGDQLLKFYNDQSKLTLGDRKLGAKDIVEQLRKEQKEFVVDSYSYGSVDENHVIITGQCIIGNSKAPFTIALESVKGSDGQSNIYITNQIMNL